jgi:hypothetical protein
MAPNLGKSLSLSVWYPISRVSMQDSVNPKPEKVGIAEEHPRHHPSQNVRHGFFVQALVHDFDLD